MRSRGMALLSVMVVAVSIIAGTSLTVQVAAPAAEPSLSGLGLVGIFLFAVYVLVTTVSVVSVAAPTSLLDSDVVLMLGAARELASATHVYENHVHDLAEQLDQWNRTLTARARMLIAGLGAAPFGVVGLVLIWVHGA